MPSLKDIRTRIASVSNTQKITSAMKMVSAAKLRRAEEAARAARPYAGKLAEVVSNLIGRLGDDAHHLLIPSSLEKNILLVVISSDRGLCGGYNANIQRSVARFIAERKADGVHCRVATVGRKAKLMAKRWEVEAVADYPDVIGSVTFAKAKEIAQNEMEAFVDGTYDAVYLVYNEFISAISYNTLIRRLLPLSMETLVSEGGGDAADYQYEPDQKELLNRVLPSHIEVQIHRALLEGAASEHGARMTAMDSATNNASDMISSLTLQYNRARQAYITKELVEIVSGAEALNG
jgi:F-type H+-transporting ATPase subunit gamma